MRVCIQLLALEHYWSIWTGSCLTALKALISQRATTTCLRTWTTGWDHSASTIMSWWKLSKRVWAHRRQTCLLQAYRNLFPDMTSASIPAVTTSDRRLGGHQSRSGRRGEEKFLTLPGLELWPLVRPARSQSLYRLLYPGSTLYMLYIKLGILNLFYLKNFITELRFSWKLLIEFPLHYRILKIIVIIKTIYQQIAYP
jgi:hypothetical protein